MSAMAFIQPLLFIPLWYRTRNWLASVVALRDEQAWAERQNRTACRRRNAIPAVVPRPATGYFKHGFRPVDEAPPHFQLLAKAVAKGEDRQPSFPNNWVLRLKKHRGLKLLYTNQCPYMGKAVEELPPVAEQHGVRFELLKLKSADEARQHLASPYGMVNLVYKGQLLADHPISATPFRNILQKDLGLSPRS